MYFLQIPSNDNGPFMVRDTEKAEETNNMLNTEVHQYLIPVLQSLETETQLQLILDVSADSPVIENLIKSSETCIIPSLTQVQEISLNTLNSILINASDLKLVTSNQLAKQSPVTNLNEHNVKTNDNLSLKCTSNFISVLDQKVLPRAVLTLPSPLQLRKEAVFTKRTLPACCRFGPVKGEFIKVSQEKAKELLEKSKSENKPIYLVQRDNSIFQIDVSDKDKANWFSLVSLGDAQSANVWLKQENTELFAVSVKPIPPRSEIKIGYSREYLQSYELILDDFPFLDFDIVTPVKSYQTWQYERCGCPDTNNDCLIKKQPLHKRCPYKCAHCGARFVRRYTLKRHIHNYCSKKVDTSLKDEDNSETVNVPVCSATPAPSIDDSKLPSDESLQNLTASLDFPANLFDSDRISNLDLSVRSEDFGLCAIGGRDENCLNVSISIDKMKQEIDASFGTQLLANCTDCDQIIVKDKVESHRRLCPSRKHKCECGATFSAKDQLNSHLEKDHQAKNGLESDEESEYFCEACGIYFKRRGMLINHLHTKHNRSPSRVRAGYKPLVRYKCSECSKEYRHAAKRRAHVIRHHPGVDPNKGEIIECGRIKRSAVKCLDLDCHRQYATRAKMMTHWRHKHKDSNTTESH